MEPRRLRLASTVGLPVRRYVKIPDPSHFSPNPRAERVARVLLRSRNAQRLGLKNAVPVESGAGYRRRDASISVSDNGGYQVARCYASAKPIGHNSNHRISAVLPDRGSKGKAECP
jgi:hypothetical protein